MKSSWKVALGVVTGLLVSMMVLTWLNVENGTEYDTKYQHEMESDANPLLGTTSLPENFVLDESFVTHLPLVIIDFQGNTVPNIYSFTSDGEGRQYSKEGLINPDPWVDMSIQIINNDNNENHLTDTPELVNNGKIKLRGMSSRSFPKKQYGIKLMDGTEELEVSVLGMEEDEDWVLSNSILDMSRIRNYVAMNLGRQIFPYTSEVRFCEVVFKEGDKYTYQGLYLLEESVKQAPGRIDIADYDESAVSLSYAVCRDRRDETGLTLSTWASDNKICYGYFTMVYPKEELLSAEAIQTIESELSRIECCLYSDNPEIFMQYKEYLDVDSFVDYYVFHEFMMNYDAGNNSTYYYKTEDGKLAIGPVWDFDNAIDNYIYDNTNMLGDNFASQPWFERLFLDSDFTNKVIIRYEELRKNILSEEYVFGFIDDTVVYLGNAMERDYKRWKEAYEQKYLLDVLENTDGVMIDRNSEDVAEEIQRIKDAFTIHGRWMDTGMEEKLRNRASIEIGRQSGFNRNYIAMAGVFIFVVMIILLMRVMKGEYR